MTMTNSVFSIQGGRRTIQVRCLKQTPQSYSRVAMCVVASNYVLSMCCSILYAVNVYENCPLGRRLRHTRDIHATHPNDRHVSFNHVRELCLPVLARSLQQRLKSTGTGIFLVLVSKYIIRQPAGLPPPGSMVELPWPRGQGSAPLLKY
jgi:hypothetical protein